MIRTKDYDGSNQPSQSLVCDSHFFRAILEWVIFIIQHRKRTFIASLHLFNERRKADSCAHMKFVISARIINFAISFN